MKKISYNITVSKGKNQIELKQVNGYLLVKDGVKYGIDHRNKYYGWIITELRTGRKVDGAGSLHEAVDVITDELNEKVKEILSRNETILVNDIDNL